MDKSSEQISGNVSYVPPLVARSPGRLSTVAHALVASAIGSAVAAAIGKALISSSEPFDAPLSPRRPSKPVDEPDRNRDIEKPEDT